MTRWRINPPDPREMADALLGLALAMCNTSGERAQDERRSHDERREALSQGFGYLLVAHVHGIHFADENDQDPEGGRP